MRRGVSVGKVVVGCTLGLLVLGLAMLWPLVRLVADGGSTATVPDPVTITEYRADLAIDERGRMHAVERITTAFPPARHGIFRFWDLVDPNDPSIRLEPKDIQVRLDGADVPVQLLWEKGRRYRVAKIGDPQDFVAPGRHVYTISYTVDDVLAPTTAGQDRAQTGSWTSDGEQGSVLYWNVVAPGWQMLIDQAEIRVSLPGVSGEVQCAVGEITEGACRLSGVGTDRLVIRTGTLLPQTPVTIRTELPTSSPGRTEVPWPVALDPILGRSPFAVAVACVLGAIGLLLGLWQMMSARERPPGYPVTYEPPDGLGPVQAYYVMHEKVPAQAITATLLHQAQRGLTRIEENGTGDFVVTATADRTAWGRVDEVTRHVGERLGVVEGRFAADGSTVAGQHLDGVQDTMRSITSAWARREGLVAESHRESLAAVAVVAMALLTVGMLVWNPWQMTVAAAPTGAYAVGAAGMLRPGTGTRRTRSGRDVWSRVGGFHRLLSTPSAQDRFDFSANRELYTAFVPYAVAFGCAEEWARKYELSTGQPAPMPSWYGAHGTGHGYVAAGSAFSGFESSLRSSISAYEATQRSSSSSDGDGGGGGGFSGGGGGGGGGGGSW